jgi:hypothetical protein
MLSQALNLRKLSYVLFIGDKNQFLAQLPTVQEKLVDTLRSVPAPVVQSEVYLCVRVLLCRLSAHNLTSFWPVILTELVSRASAGCLATRIIFCTYSTVCSNKHSQMCLLMDLKTCL